MNIKSLYIAFLLIVIASCEKESSIENISKEVFLESYIHPGDSIGVQIMQILKYQSEDTIVKSIDTCHVSINLNGYEYKLNSAGNGAYYIKDSSINMKAGDSLNIYFSYSGYPIKAKTFIPTRPTNFKTSATTVSVPSFNSGSPRGQFGQMTPVELTWDNADNSYYLVAIETAETNPTPVMTDDTVENKGRFRIFRNEPSTASSYRMEPMQFKYLGKQRVILYHLNPEYAALYKFSGNTSLNITEPQTSIENGLGIFTGMNTDTLFVNVVRQ